MLSGSAITAQAVAPSVQANGSATITAKPNQAQLDVGVVTNGANAQDASQQNASLSNSVQAALSKVLGSAGTLQTVSYYVTPRYSSTPNQPSVIIGYTASNTVRVTTTDLSQIGLLIDAANQAGANSVGGLSFGLQNPEPLVEQALTQATKQATAHAAAIAAGLGGKLGAVLSAQEGSSYAPIVVGSANAGAAVTTPIQTGTVTVYATVTIRVELAQ
ncbi:MAG: SIMPL domain-containing protein [Candidatus Solibacter sp.]|nr:SIMPL domain-containing protein [Candidatus Solibacter sp.]